LIKIYYRKLKNYQKKNQNKVHPSSIMHQRLTIDTVFKHHPNLERYLPHSWKNKYWKMNKNYKKFIYKCLSLEKNHQKGLRKRKLDNLN